ncbi:MAG: lamin tail domain-containing protein [Candidatus Omnitrophota bacterium]
MRIKLLVMVMVILGAALSANVFADVIINEAMIDPNAVSDTYGEWIELFNTGVEDIDINSWVLKDADSNYHQINNNGPLIILANDFLVLGRNIDTNLNGNYIADYEYDSFTLANTEDEIILENNSTEIDSIFYNSNWPLSSGKSLAYSGIGNNNNYINWFATPSDANYVYGIGDYGTPGAANTIPEPSTLILCLAGLFFWPYFKKNY